MEPNEEDIKAECIEIVPTLDISSVTATSNNVFMLDGAEAGNGSNDVFMSDQIEAVPGTSSTFPADRVEGSAWSKLESGWVTRFIEYVRNCPEIWDISSGAYREKVLRRRTFKRIGEEFGLTYDDVVKKYNNLRTYYTKEIIKQKKFDNFRSRWPYFQQLDSFLRKTVHTRQPRAPLTARWTRIANKYLDRSQVYESTHLAAGFRRKRQLGIGDARQRNNINNRGSATSATSTANNTLQSAVVTLPLTSTAATSPQINQISIAHVRSLALQQQPRTALPSASSRLQRHLTQSQPSQQSTRTAPPPPPSLAPTTPTVVQQQQRKSQGKQQQQQQQQQPQNGAPKSSEPQTARTATTPSSSMMRPSSSTSTSLPSSSSLSSSSDRESSDMIFGKLVASQLAKMEEGRKKEDLKINLLQQIVRSMFDEEQT